MATYKKEYNLRIELTNDAASDEEATAKSLRQLSNIQLNLSNSFTKTSLLLKEE